MNSIVKYITLLITTYNAIKDTYKLHKQLNLINYKNKTK